MHRVLDLISEQVSGGLGMYPSQASTLALFIDLGSVD
jgi:hypothetical protein